MNVNAAPANGGNPVLHAGGIAMTVGWLGVLATTVCYALSPPAAAMPHQPFQLGAALEGAAAGAATMIAASFAGMFSDIVLATGTLLVALELVRRGRGVAAAGWIAMFLSVVIFALVDTMVGQVLVPLAATQGGASAFAGFKYLFDALFLLGTIAFGAGAIVALASDCRSAAPLVPRRLTYIGIAIGALGSVAALGCFAHLPLDLAVGASIGLGAVLFTVIGVTIARGARA
jgi:hypothetical protein